MNAYVYQAELLCEPCGDSICLWLSVMGKAPADRNDETTFDSDDFPKGPYPDGGGEADSEQHCGRCGVALENSVIPIFLPRSLGDWLGHENHDERNTP